ncbi:Protein of unknown function [Bacillus cytotoxicus]|nr:Protein of unknown function [Bacillus cytotoxicus]
MVNRKKCRLNSGTVTFFEHSTNTGETS